MILGSPMKNPNSQSILKLQDIADEQAVPISVVGKRHDPKLINWEQSSYRWKTLALTGVTDQVADSPYPIPRQHLQKHS